MENTFSAFSSYIYSLKWLWGHTPPALVSPPSVPNGFTRHHVFLTWLGTSSKSRFASFPGTLLLVTIHSTRATYSKGYMTFWVPRSIHITFCASIIILSLVSYCVEKT